MGWLRRRKYVALLLALFLAVIVYPFTRDHLANRVLYDLLVAGVMLAGLVSVCVEWRHRFIALGLCVPSLLGLATGYVVPGLPRWPLALALHTGALLFLAFCVFVILRAVYREEDLSIDSIHGALCGYVLVALAFGHVYCIVELAAPGSFRVGEGGVPQGDAAQAHFLLTYFSMVTLTTVGYGDVVPVSNGARGLAVVEAALGQFYLAVLIAELVGRRLSQSMGAGGGPPPPGR